MKIEFEVPGEPTAKARARVTKSGFAYTPSKTKEYENWVKTCFAMKYKNFTLLENRLKVQITAYFSVPKSATRGKRTAMLYDIVSPTKKPDRGQYSQSST